MKIYIKILLALIFTVSAHAGEIRDNAYCGSHFMFCYMQNSIDEMLASNSMQVFAVVLPKADGTLTVKYSSTVTTYSLKKNQALKLQFPKSLEIKTAGAISSSVIDLSSNAQFSVIALSNYLQSSEALNAIPVPKWGKSYVVSSMPNDSLYVSGKSYISQGEFVIIASENGTSVDIVSPVKTNENYPAYAKNTITLNAGEAYLVKSAKSNARGYGDLSGATVKSTKPIGLIAGHIRTGIPTGWNSNNHIAEMLAPTDNWGKYFITTPSALPVNSEIYKIIALKDSTKITIATDDSAKTIILAQANTPYTISGFNTGAFWNASSPIQVCLMFSHTGTLSDNQNFDPAMTTISPIEQSISSASFISFDTSYSIAKYYAFSSHYANIVFDSSAYNYLTLDGTLVKNLSSKIKRISGSNYFGATIKVSAGSHLLNSSQGYFSGYFYGTSGQDAYATTLGATFSSISQNDADAPLFTFEKNCENYEITINDKISWNYSGIASIKFNSDSTKNFSYTTPVIADSTSVVQISAKVIDVSKDASLSITYADKSGNKATKVIKYNTPNLSYPKGVTFGVVPIDSIITKNVALVNNGLDTIKIDSISLSSKNNFTIDTKFTFPIVLAPKANYSFAVSNVKIASLQSLSANLSLFYACGEITAKIPIDGNAGYPAPSVEPDPLVFSTINSGDSSESFVCVKNIGSASIYINSIIASGDASAFVVNDGYSIGKSLSSNDSFNIKVKFLPQAEKTYTAYYTLKNNYNIKLGFTVIGSAYACNIKGENLEFQAQRIESQKDSVIVLKNIGSSACKLSFASVDGDVSSFDLTNIKAIKDYSINALDSLPIKISSIPQKNGKNSVKANFAINGQSQNILSIQIASTSISPILIADTCFLDTVVVNSSKDFNVVIFENKGNDSANIEKIEFLGDTNEFIFQNISEKTKILSNSLLYLQIRFSPKARGNYKTLIKISASDGPNYSLVEHYALINAIAASNDTLRAEINFIDAPKANACQIGKAQAYLKNTGNADIVIDSISASGENFYARIIGSDTLINKMLAPKDSLKFYYEYLLDKTQSGTINLFAKMSDTVRVFSQINIQPSILELDIKGESEVEIEPGKNVSVNFSGSCPEQTYSNYSLSLGLKFNAFEFSIPKQTLFFELTDKSGNIIKAPAKIDIGQDSATIQTETNIIGSEIISWKLVFDAYPYLSSNKYPEISATAFGEPCFVPQTALAKCKMINVCDYNLFPLVVATDFAYASIVPMPVSGTIHLQVFVPNNETATINIQDQIGKNISTFSNINLQKGNHYLNFEIPNIANGFYNLQVQLSSIVINKFFIVNK